MIPQYFLARENGFVSWVLSPVYYGSNCYSKDTCAFLGQKETEEYEQGKHLRAIARKGSDLASCDISVANTNEFLYRYELSRNQVVELLKGLKNNPYGRRHIISFWHWANIDKKSLVECAY